MEEEIRLINEIIANAVIHGADSGGTYNQNKIGLYRAMNNWIKAKGLKNEYHVIMKGYEFKANEDPNSKYMEGGWAIPMIAPVSEKPIQFYEDYFDDLDDK